jgi:hypothetical protein
MRHVLISFALTASLLLAMPASALAAGSRGEDSGGVLTLAWERLVGFWDEVWEAAGGLMPALEKDTAGPDGDGPPGPPPPGPGPGPAPSDYGDQGTGIDPQG